MLLMLDEPIGDHTVSNADRSLIRNASRTEPDEYAQKVTMADLMDLPKMSPIRRTGYRGDMYPPHFECSICGADMGPLLSGFCQRCHLQQERVLLEDEYANAIALYSAAKRKLLEAKKALKTNAKAQEDQHSV